MQDLIERKKIFCIAKEFIQCIFIVSVLMTMDRNLENMYCFFLYDTGKRYLDIFMSLYLHAHRWFPWLISIVFFIWLYNNRFRVNYGILFPICAVYLAYLLTSLLTCGYTFRWANTTLYPMMMYLFVTMMCSTERSRKRFFRISTDLYICLLLLNAGFTMFPSLYHLFTDWVPDYFLSADNLTGFPMFYGLLLSGFDKKYNKSNVRWLIYLILFVINQALIHCVGSLLAAGIFALYLLIPALRHVFENRRLLLFVMLTFLFGVLLIFCAYMYMHNTAFSNFLWPLINLRLSMLIRFIIWSGSFGLILEKPLFGHGLGEKAEFFDRPNTSLSYNAHNAYLQTVYEGGLFTQFMVLFCFYILSKKLQTCRDKKISGYISIIIFSVLIMMQTAITSWFTWYPVLLIAQTGIICCSEEDF